MRRRTGHSTFHFPRRPRSSAEMLSARRRNSPRRSFSAGCRPLLCRFTTRPALSSARQVANTPGCRSCSGRCSHWVWSVSSMASSTISYRTRSGSMDFTLCQLPASSATSTETRLPTKLAPRSTTPISRSRCSGASLSTFPSCATGSREEFSRSTGAWLMFSDPSACTQRMSG